MVNKKPKFKQRFFNVDFLRLYIKKNNHDESEPYNLSKHLGEIEKVNTKERVIFYNGDTVRLQSIEKLTETFDNLENCKDLWKLTFIRLKDSELLGVADEEGNYDEEKLKDALEDKQHLASPTPCIYDGEKNIFIIARNREGVFPTAILRFLSKMLKDILGDNGLHFAIIPNEKGLKVDDTIIYKNVEITIDNIKKYTVEQNKLLKKHAGTIYSMINSAKSFGINKVKVKLSASLKKEDSMDKLLVSNELTGLNELRDTPDLGFENIKNLEVDVKESAGTKIETIDLINNKIRDNFSIKFEKGDTIKVREVYTRLLGSYSNKFKIISAKI
ncbi:DUF6731 family protein [Clostridium botulinum]|uniref:DUF6731 family protein n=1 Tax=Clostridium botulinum TaxID=1491 RepID=UPI00174B1B2A|nr:DUF6731 family protein [Clostridium botulinum]MBD5572414.1 hypothetical protein [Clostridium botulinum]